MIFYVEFTKNLILFSLFTPRFFIRNKRHKRRGTFFEGRGGEAGSRVGGGSNSLERVSKCFEDIFLKYRCGYWKAFRTQQCLLTMLEKWNRCVDNSKMFGASLTDLWKVFEFFDHELLIAKLNACDFSSTPLKLVHNYL